MTDKARRRELTAAFKQARPAAGVYLISNPASGRGLLGSTTNLPSVRNRLEFAQQMQSPHALHPKLRREVADGGLEGLTFEVLEQLEVGPEVTDDSVASDLKTLESLWREKLGPERLVD